MFMVRKAGLKDLDDILILWEGLVNDQTEYRVPGTEDSIMPDMKDDAKEIFRAFAKRTIHSKNGIIMVAVQGENIVGYLLGFLQKNVPVFKGDLVAYISDIFVKEEYRSMGIATAMNDRFEEWLKSKGISTSTLQVITTNDIASKLYRKWGYGDIFITMRKDRI